MHESITAYIFDMDGTLFDTSSRVPQAFIECVIAVGGRRYSPEEVVASYGLGRALITVTHLHEAIPVCESPGECAKALSLAEGSGR